MLGELGGQRLAGGEPPADQRGNHGAEADGSAGRTRRRGLGTTCRVYPPAASRACTDGMARQCCSSGLPHRCRPARCCVAMFYLPGRPMDQEKVRPLGPVVRQARRVMVERAG